MESRHTVGMHRHREECSRSSSALPAAIGRIGGKVDGHARMMGEWHDTVQKLWAKALPFWAIIESDHQCHDVCKPVTHGFPPQMKQIDQTIAGDPRGDSVDKKFIRGRKQKPNGRYAQFGLNIMIRRDGWHTDNDGRLKWCLPWHTALRGNGLRGHEGRWRFHKRRGGGS